MRLHRPQSAAWSLMLAVGLTACSQPATYASIEDEAPLLTRTANFGSLDSALHRDFAPQLADYLRRQRIPGLAIGAVRNGEIVYAQGFGELSRGSGKPVTVDSIFHTASLSKPMTATAVMQLVENGKLRLDQPVHEILPYFELADAESREITLRQILTHTSGMPDVQGYDWDKPRYDSGAAERMVRRLHDRKLEFAPGADMSYSNLAFDVLGDVIAKTSGMSFEDYMQENILRPLGMSHSSFMPRELPDGHRTQGHSPAFSQRVDHPIDPIYPYNRRHAPSSTLNSSVADMCRWMIANLNHGELDGARILESEGYAEMWNVSDDTPSIGLGWWIGPLANRPAINHSGGDDGYVAFCVMIEQEDLGVVVLCNSDAIGVGSIAGAAARVMLEEEWQMPKLNLTPVIAEVLEERGVAAALAKFKQLDETEHADWDLSWYALDTIVARLKYRDRLQEALEIARRNRTRFTDEPKTLERLREIESAIANQRNRATAGGTWSAEFRHEHRVTPDLAALTILTGTGNITVRPTDGANIVFDVQVEADIDSVPSAKLIDRMAAHAPIRYRSGQLELTSAHLGDDDNKGEQWRVSVIAHVPSGIELRAETLTGSVKVLTPSHDIPQILARSGAGNIEIDLEQVRERVDLAVGAGQIIARVKTGTPSDGFHLSVGAGSVQLQCSPDVYGKFRIDCPVGGITVPEQLGIKVTRTNVGASAKGETGNHSTPVHTLASHAGSVEISLHRK